MRISELSARSGVSQATIKYYIREGLLAPGDKTSRNQAQYSEQHLDRLKLILALRDVGGLGVDAIKGLVDALAGAPSLQVAAMAHARLNPPRDPSLRDPSWSASADELAALLTGLGWQSYRESPVFAQLVDVYVALRQAWPAVLGPGGLPAEALRPYAEAAHQVAAFELAGDVDVTRLSAEDQMRWVVLGTVLMEPVLLALRRVAQQEIGSKRWGHLFDQDAWP